MRLHVTGSSEVLTQPFFHHMSDSKNHKKTVGIIPPRCKCFPSGPVCFVKTGRKKIRRVKLPDFGLLSEEAASWTAIRKVKLEEFVRPKSVCHVTDRTTPKPNSLKLLAASFMCVVLRMCPRYKHSTNPCRIPGGAPVGSNG